MQAVGAKPVRVAVQEWPWSQALLSGAWSLLTGIITAVDFISWLSALFLETFGSTLAYIQAAFFPRLQKYLEQKRDEWGKVIAKDILNPFEGKMRTWSTDHEEQSQLVPFSSKPASPLSHPDARLLGPCPFFTTPDTFLPTSACAVPSSLTFKWALFHPSFHASSSRKFSLVPPLKAFSQFPLRCFVCTSLACFFLSFR